MSDFSQSESLTHIFTGPNVISVSGSQYSTPLHLPHYISNVITFTTILVGSPPGYKPLSEPMMVGLPTHICVSRPQWVNGHHEDRYPLYFEFWTSLLTLDLVMGTPATYCHTSRAECKLVYLRQVSIQDTTVYTKLWILSVGSEGDLSAWKFHKFCYVWIVYKKKFCRLIKKKKKDSSFL